MEVGTLERKRAEAEARASDDEATRRVNDTPDSDPPDLPGEGDDEQPDEVTQLSISGDADVTMSVVGGRKADQSTLRIKGGEISVAGAVKKGDRVRIVLEGVIAEAHFIDIIDSKTREVTATKRKHILKPDFIERQAVGGGPLV